MSAISEFFRKLFWRMPSPPSGLVKPKPGAVVFYLERGHNEIRSTSDLKSLASRINGARVGGSTLDLGGAILSGKKLRGKGDQSEDQDPLLRVLMDGVKIRNGFFRDVKDGLHFAGKDCTVEDCHWLDVGEDAVNNRKGARGTRVIDCTFNTSKKGNDKTLQINEGRDALVSGCLIYGGITGIRLGDKWSDSSDRAKVRNTTFVGTRTAMNLAKITVETSGCRYVSVIKKVVHSIGSRLEEK